MSPEQFCVPAMGVLSTEESAYYPFFPRTTGSLPTSAESRDNQLGITTVDGLNNAIFVCNVTNVLRSEQAKVTILDKGELSSNVGEGCSRVAPREGI